MFGVTQSQVKGAVIDVEVGSTCSDREVDALLAEIMKPECVPATPQPKATPILAETGIAFEDLRSSASGSVLPQLGVNLCSDKRAMEDSSSAAGKNTGLAMVFAPSKKSKPNYVSIAPILSGEPREALSLSKSLRPQLKSSRNNEQRRIANRLSSGRWRQRQNTHIRELSLMVEALKAENINLKATIAAYEQR